VDEHDDYADPPVPVLSARQVFLLRLLLLVGCALGTYAWLLALGR
jgi:hypothetical protein